MTEPTITRENGVCRVVLRDPARRNPLSLAVLETLEATALALEGDPATRILHIRGEGTNFSAGMDLAARMPKADSWRQNRWLHGRWLRLLDRIERLPQTTIAELHGAVVGGGVVLAMAFDLRIGATDVAFSVPEVRLGVPLTWGGVPRLAREVGLPRARDMVMTGRRVVGEEALAWGLVTRMVSLADLRTAGEAIIAEVLSVPEAPSAMTKDAFAALSRAQLGAGAWADGDHSWWARQEPESTEALTAYKTRLAAQRSKKSDKD